MTDVIAIRECGTCKNTGVIEVEPKQWKFCPACGGSSNPALAEEIEARKERERARAVAAGRAGADRKRKIRKQRKANRRHG